MVDRFDAEWRKLQPSLLPVLKPSKYMPCYHQNLYINLKVESYLKFVSVLYEILLDVFLMTFFQHPVWL